MPKRKYKITITFATVTQESCEHGDFERTGWEDKEGKEFDSLLEVYEFLEQAGAYHFSCGHHFDIHGWYSTDSIDHWNMPGWAWTSIQTNESITFNFHLKNFKERAKNAIFEKLINGKTLKQPVPTSIDRLSGHNWLS